MEDEDKMVITHMRESGLISVSIYGQTVELCLEDIAEINGIVQNVGKNKVANREDFID